MNARTMLIGIPAAIVGVVVLIPIAVVTVLLLGVTSFTRFVEKRFGGAERAAPWQDFVEFEPTVGWRLKANLDAYGRADDLFRISTGADGWRGQMPIEDADVVVFGDSYAFGHGADDGRMYSDLAGTLRVKPIGSDGYDMVQALLWMERYERELAGKRVVWFVYYGNDLWENLLPAMGHYRKPYVRQSEHGGWEIAADHVTVEPWPFPASRSYHEPLAEICSDTSLSRRVQSSCRGLIERAQRVCVSAGADLTIVGVPDRIQLTARGAAKLESLAPKGAFRGALHPDRFLEDICEDLGIGFEPLSRHLTERDYLLQDIHWRPSGHRKVGALIQSLASNDAN